MDIINKILKLFEINIIKTILLNFRLFPFRVAVKIPIIVYGRYYVYNIMSLQRGQIELRCPCKTGMVRLNRRIGVNLGCRLRGTLCLQGKIIIEGICDIGQGCNLTIRKGAKLYVSDRLSITGASKIHVYEHVRFGRRVIISWNVQIHDTDYHYFIKDNKIFSRNIPIYIGDNVWIGHDVTISKGAYIPSDCIVASYSLVNSRFSESKDGMLLAGIPAIVKGFNLKPINDYLKDSEIDQYFKTHNVSINDGVIASLFE